VVAVIRGKHQAELAVKKFEDAQNSSDLHEGWRYLIDKTDLKAGTDPLKLHCIARRNWKGENQKLCGSQTVRTFLRHIARDETRFPGKQIREQHLSLRCGRLHPQGIASASLTSITLVALCQVANIPERLFAGIEE
jgi:hypothetical protein